MATNINDKVLSSSPIAIDRKIKLFSNSPKSAGYMHK